MLQEGPRIVWVHRVVAVLGVAATCFFWPMLTREPLKVLRPGGLPATVERGAEISNLHLVGYTRSEMSEKYGPPTSKGIGRRHPTHWRWFRKYPDEVYWLFETATGTLEVCFILQRGEWTCSSSLWLPTGYGF